MVSVSHLILVFALVLAVMAEAESSSSFGSSGGWGGQAAGLMNIAASPAATCHSRVDDCIIDEAEEEMSMDSESNRRQFAQVRYISYEALRKDSIPCGFRGNSYYNCTKHIQANPYTRGCTMITKCARNTR